MNKRQKKKLFKKKSAFYPNGGPDVFLFQVFTGVGMTKKKWKKLDKMLEELFGDMEYDRNTRNVENFNQGMAERKQKCRSRKW
nr:hypothetical protein [uncultured Blautia sp.]